MGYYIETNSRNNKAQWLLNNANGSTTPRPGDVPVVVMDNGPFEAAGIAFNADELAAFTRPNDLRKKTIVYVPRDEVIRLCPSVEKLLA